MFESSNETLFTVFTSASQALGRLTDREAYDRSFRFKRASQASVMHIDLPKDQWTKPAEVRI